MSKHPKHAVKKHAQSILNVIQEYPWIAVLFVVFLIGLRFLIPHFPALGNWSKSYSYSVMEIALQDLPQGTLVGPTPEDVLRLFADNPMITTDAIHFNGPVITHAWRCKPLNLDAGCLRLSWRGENLTLAVTHKIPNLKRAKIPFLKQGWGGAFIHREAKAWVLVGPFTPEELYEAWPYANLPAPTATPAAH
jgi:hypothetical protein